MTKQEFLARVNTSEVKYAEQFKEVYADSYIKNIRTENRKGSFKEIKRYLIDNQDFIQEVFNTVFKFTEIVDYCGNEYGENMVNEYVTKTVATIITKYVMFEYGCMQVTENNEIHMVCVFGDNEIEQLIEDFIKVIQPYFNFNLEWK